MTSNFLPVFVVIEIVDPNMYFKPNQSQYIRYEANKQLVIVGVYEDRSAAESECDKAPNRHMLTTNYYKSIFSVSPMDIS